MASNITTTEIPAASSGDTSNKDLLLIVASVAMAVATVLLILIVKLLERCIPNPRNVQESETQKAERVKAVLSQETKLMTYSEWVLAERLKHHHESGQPTPTNLQESDEPAGPSDGHSRDLSSRLASAPKEEEVWATDCAVCLGEFEQDEQIRELPCEHIFHDNCIHDWFMKAKLAACPLCRNQLHSGASVADLSGQPLPQPTEQPPVEVV